MAPPGQHRSPERAPGAPANALGGASTVTETTDVVVDGAPATVFFDAARSRSEDVSRRLLTASRTEREAYFAGREDGFVDGERVGFARGIERGRQLADDEAQWPLSLAEHHVHRLAEILPHEDRRERALGSGTSCGDAVEPKAIDRPEGTTFHPVVGT